MKKFITLIILSFIICVTLISCGPSPEEISQMTAAAWTDTPEPTATSTPTPTATPTMTPTPTPTPVPYDMELTLVGEGGESVTFDVHVTVTGSDEVLMDESGVIEFMDLAGPDVEVSVKAQGYAPHVETLTLARGPNPVTLTLTLDPTQINPATACAEGQTILLIEDFEDQLMQGWEGQLARPLFEFVEVEGRGMVLQVDRSVEGEGYLRYPEVFENMVWHYDILRYPNNGPMWMRFHETPGVGAYISVIDGGQGFMIQKEPGGSLGDRYWVVSDGETWEKFSLVYFDGMVEVWINDELFVGVTDNDPYLDGSISMAFQTPSGGYTLIDNIIICELTEPYAPPLVEEAVE